jgi:anionic cell wall polymer biosynthesis LytR-Cps2A-Psr (LCP) family protein
VNFFGFQKIAQRVGGVEIDITEAEKDKINKMIVQQARIAYKEGIDESDQENVYLETYGENTHLNGRQTLAYARIRKLTGGDAMRTERQRIVLEKLLQKVKNLDAIQLAALARDMIDQVKTNLPFEDLFTIAMQVCGNGIGNVKSMRLPVSGTYKEEVRNDQSMLYDCDFQANTRELYNFIYET